jgi:PST family polysaccharide transporter
MGLGNIMAGFVSIYIATRFLKLTWFRPALTDLKYELKEGWHITLTNLSQITIQYIGVFILRIFTNDVVVGYYSVAERVYFAMKMMLDVFTQAVYPRVCLLLQEGIGSVNRFFRRTYLPFLYLVMIGSTVIFFLSREIIHFFMGHYNSNAAFLLRVLSVALVIICLQVPASLVLLAGNHKKNYLRIFTVGTFVNIATNFAFVPIWEASGTVLSVIITELVIVLYLYWELYRLYRIKIQPEFETG